MEGSYWNGKKSQTMKSANKSGGQAEKGIVFYG